MKKSDFWETARPVGSFIMVVPLREEEEYFAGGLLRPTEQMINALTDDAAAAGMRALNSLRLGVVSKVSEAVALALSTGEFAGLVGATVAYRPDSFMEVNALTGEGLLLLDAIIARSPAPLA